MPKGMFTQTTVILLRQEMSPDEIRPLLSDFRVVKEVTAAERWEVAGPSLVIEYDERVNGFVSIDVVNNPWPDGMGDPKSNPMLFGAWSMGHFGPFAYPNGLLRAVQQSWRCSEAKELVGAHKGFIRFRMSYVFGGDKNAPVLPKDYAPLKELEFLSALTSPVLAHTNALCYFNPNGEVLLNQQMFDESRTYHRQHDLPPLDVWSNIRMFNLSENWVFMDSVGCWQLDVPDQEVAFPKGVAPQEIDSFIRNVTLYIIKNGMVIKSGDTMTGPGGNWRATVLEKGLGPPPRRVIRWLQISAQNLPPELLKTQPTVNG